MATDRAHYLQHADPETLRKYVVQMQTDSARIRSLEDKLKSLEDAHSKCTMKVLDLRNTITVERRRRELKETEVEELKGEVVQLQALVEKRAEWMDIVLCFLLTGAEERAAQLKRAEEIQRKSGERLLEQRKVSRQRERGIRLVFALKARELQVKTHEHEAECVRSTKERNAALERESALRAQLALLQQKCQNPTLELVETLKAQVRHLQNEKDELVKEEVRRLQASSQWNLNAQVGNESRVISDLRAQHEEMSKTLCDLRKDAEQAKELKADYVKMFGEVRGLQEELCIRDKELRDARRQVDEMKAHRNMRGGDSRPAHPSSTRLEDMAMEVLRGM